MGYRRVAAVDIGTNSVRLLVAEVSVKNGEPELETLQRIMRITRLGRGVDERGRLEDEAVERTAAVLRDYREIIGRENVEAWVVAATSAARDAANADEFLRLAEDIMGREPRVVTGEEEARLSFSGATYDLGELAPGSGPVLVADIGGGSTEMIVGTDGKILETHSLDMGCVRMSERFLEADPPLAEELERMEAHVSALLEPVKEGILESSPELMVGLAGTVTTLSGIRLGLSSYDGEAIHHSRLTRDEVEELYGSLASLPLEERRDFMGLEPGRADVIIGGAGVLAVLLRELSFESLLVSEKDILDGLVIAEASIA